MTIPLEHQRRTASPRPLIENDQLRPLRVLHCIPTLSLGGAQRVMIEIVRQLDSHPINAEVVIIGTSETAVEWPALDVVPQFLNYRGSLRDWRGFRRAARELVRILRDGQFDLIHSHLWNAATLAGSAATTASVPHLAHVHDTRPWLVDNDWRSRFQRWWTRHCLSGEPTTFAAVSQDAWSYNSVPLRLQNRSHQIVPNGVNTAEFRPSASQRASNHERHVPRVGVVARFNREKGHANLIHAASLLIHGGTPLELHLAGHGSLYEECRQLAAELGIADAVHFTGVITDVPAFLGTLDIFILPSLACEGMPLSILEAMACRLPVIATDVGGTAEILNHRVNGLLIPPNDVEAIAGSIRELIDAPELCESLATAASEHVHKDHSWERVTRTFIDVYGQMVGQHRS